MITDSASTDEEGTLVIRRGNTKSWLVSLTSGLQLLVGFAGNYSDGTFLRHTFKWPTMKRSSFMKYFSKDVTKSIRAQLKEQHGDESNTSASDWTLLIGYHDGTGPHLVVLYQNGDIEESNLDFTAIGSGSAYALGALDSIGRTQNYMSIPDRLHLAMKVAQNHTVGVREPFHMLQLRE
jgi:ATP-dependent protease HslVU (ClpYQ) peptidase subunit